MLNAKATTSTKSHLKLNDNKETMAKTSHTAGAMYKAPQNTLESVLLTTRFFFFKKKKKLTNVYQIYYII